jgi:beta-phosphoglucomutase-like phosphatase (HAD superfamily)
VTNRTLIDSTPGLLKAWDAFAEKYSLNAKEVAHATHGRRLHDTLKEWCRIEDEETLQVPFFAACTSLPFITLARPKLFDLKTRLSKVALFCFPG